MSSPNDKPDPFAPQGGGQTYVPPTAPLQAREPAMIDGPRVQIAQSATAAPSGHPAPFAPQVMGSPPASFAPQVMGTSPGSFAPQVMGTSPGSFAPQVMGAVAPAPMAPVPPMAPASPAGDPSAAGFAPYPGAPVVAPPQMGAPLEPPPSPAASGAALGAAAPADDPGLAASPWNTGNMAGFNRDLLPSAMVAPPPEAPLVARRGAAAALAEEPSRAPWIIVGVLVLVAIAGGVAVFQIRGSQGKDGQIAVPAGGSTATTDDTPADSAPAASASAGSAGGPTRAVAPVRPVAKPKAFVDDPYGDAPPSARPRPAPTATPAGSPGSAPHRLFGSEN